MEPTSEYENSINGLSRMLGIQSEYYARELRVPTGNSRVDNTLGSQVAAVEHLRNPYNGGINNAQNSDVYTTTTSTTNAAIRPQPSTSNDYIYFIEGELNTGLEKIVTLENKVHILENEIREERSKNGYLEFEISLLKDNLEELKKAIDKIELIKYKQLTSVL